MAEVMLEGFPLVRTPNELHFTDRTHFEGNPVLVPELGVASLQGTRADSASIYKLKVIFRGGLPFSQVSCRFYHEAFGPGRSFMGTLRRRIEVFEIDEWMDQDQSPGNILVTSGANPENVGILLTHFRFHFKAYI